MSLAELLQHSHEVWRCRAFPQASQGRLASGFEALDKRLGGGWPTGVMELLGCGPLLPGAMELLLPAMIRLSHQESRRILLVNPPLPPYQPGFAMRGLDTARLLWLQAETRRDALWALETAAASGACSMLLGWFEEGDAAGVRRLQLAARRGDCRCFLLLSRQADGLASPAVLRLKVRRDHHQLLVDLLKLRGGVPVSGLSLPLAG